MQKDFEEARAFGTAQLKNNEDVLGRFGAVGQGNRRCGQQSTIGVAVKKRYNSYRMPVVLGGSVNPGL